MQHIGSHDCLDIGLSDMRTLLALSTSLALAAVGAMCFGCNARAAKPIGSGTHGSTCDYNPALYKKGNTYKVISKLTYDGKKYTTQEVDSKVIGPAFFRGNRLIEVQERQIFNSNKSLQIERFYRIGINYYYDYGSQGLTEIYFSPPIAVPEHFAINTPYEVKTVSHIVHKGAADTQVPSHTKRTFLVMDSIKTPAGTFSACKIQSDTYKNGAKTASNYYWIVSSGRYAGLTIKTLIYMNTPAGLSASPELREVAVSLKFNGK